MNAIDLQNYYCSVYYSLRRNGSINKLILIILTIPAALYAYYDVNERYKYYEWDFPHEYVYYLSVFMLGMMIFFILTINTISFVNAQRVKSINNSFKKDLFECIKAQIPEIREYRHRLKIHPKYFIESALYKSAHTDYVGDDLFRGEYKGCRFELCELHVFKLFKSVFDGLFIRIVTTLPIQNNDTELCLNSNLDVIKDLHNIKLRIKDRNTIYIAAETRGKFFEHDNLREIHELEGEMLFLKDIVNVIRTTIDSCQPHNIPVMN